MQLRIKLLDKSIEIPEYKTEGAAGFDLVASEDCIVSDLKPTIVPTGIAIAMPPGYEAQIRPRSGLAAKIGLTVVNSPGTIDSDYRGEIKVIMQLIGRRHKTCTHRQHTIYKGDRIAQMVIQKLPSVSIIQVDELDETERGEKGFGSTGIK